MQYADRYHCTMHMCVQRNAQRKALHGTAAAGVAQGRSLLQLRLLHPRDCTTVATCDCKAFTIKCQAAAHVRLPPSSIILVQARVNMKVAMPVLLPSLVSLLVSCARAHSLQAPNCTTTPPADSPYLAHFGLELQAFVAPLGEMAASVHLGCEGQVHACTDPVCQTKPLQHASHDCHRTSVHWSVQRGRSASS